MGTRFVMAFPLTLAIILVESARYIGIAVSSLINILNPSKIVLGKEFVKYGDLVLEQLKKTALHKALDFPGSKADVAITPLGEKASMLGAAIIPLKVLFKR
jgi:predicted NBD/HSP70 family sugar kinase